MKRNKYRFERLLQRKAYLRLTMALLRKVNEGVELCGNLDELDRLFGNE